MKQTDLYYSWLKSCCE